MTAEALEKMILLEGKLSAFIRPEMTLDEKIRVLGGSFWRSHHAGYCDYVAGQRMAGVDSDEVAQHDLDLKYREDVECLLELLDEYRNELFEDEWNKASELFDRDNEAGFAAWLALSERGSARASHTVGWCYLYGNGVEKDVDKAIEYYRRAIDGGHVSSCSGLYLAYYEAGRVDEGIKALLDGAERNVASGYDMLARLCADGVIFSGNSRVAAFLASRAYELDKKCGGTLFYYYLTGYFFPRVYSYAKYCLEQSGLTKEDYEQVGIEFPDYWDEIEPIPPKYPDFGLTLDSCEGAVDPDALLTEAKKYMFVDKPDYPSAIPYVTRAAEAGHSQAMHYLYLMNTDGYEDWLIKGADEYGDVDCICALGYLFSINATYREGDIYLTNAIRYWKMKESLHSHEPLHGLRAEAYEEHKRMLSEMEARNAEKEECGFNAVRLTVDCSYERIRIDFDSEGGLFAPLGCDGIRLVPMQALSDELGFTVVMYCDRDGDAGCAVRNFIACDLSGEENLCGSVVICGFEDECVPLSGDELTQLCEVLALRQ